MLAIAKERKVQKRVMARVNAILRAAWTYGAEAIAENPWHSYFWKQDFCSRMNDDLPSGRKWRDIKLNMCMVGSKHFKPLRFRTTLPPKVTTAMELECDHVEPHEPCTGRTESGSLRTRASAAYLLGLLTIIVAIAALIAGVPMSEKVEAFRAEQLCPTAKSDYEPSHDNFYVSFPFDTHTSRSMGEWKHESWYEGQNECFLARHKLEIYWERVKDLPPETPSTHADVSFHETVPA